MKKSALNKSFQALRKLPLEISFAQVERWVQQSSGQKKRQGRWLPLLLRQLFWNEN